MSAFTDKYGRVYIERLAGMMRTMLSIFDTEEVREWADYTSWEDADNYFRRMRNVRGDEGYKTLAVRKRARRNAKRDKKD